MFDTTSTITIGLRTAGAGKTDITVRYPSDEEWSAHRKRSKFLIRQLGRGAQEYDSDTAAADQRLYEGIKLNGAPPLTPGEATAVIQAIGKCTEVRTDLRADDAEVELQVLTGLVTHTLRIPTMDEARKLERSTRYINLPHNLQQVQTSMEAGAALWDACNGKAEGYAGAVPGPHKDKAVRAVIEEIQREATAHYDEENF